MAESSRDPIQRFFGSHDEELVVQHVLREVRQGRPLADVLDDAYVRNRTSELERRALLDHTEIVRAVGTEVAAAIKAQM